jgi:hypothetical protein
MRRRPHQLHNAPKIWTGVFTQCFVFRCEFSRNSHCSHLQISEASDNCVNTLPLLIESSRKIHWYLSMMASAHCNIAGVTAGAGWPGHGKSHGSAYLLLVPSLIYPSNWECFCLLYSFHRHSLDTCECFPLFSFSVKLRLVMVLCLKCTLLVDTILVTHWKVTMFWNASELWT